MKLLCLQLFSVNIKKLKLFVEVKDDKKYNVFPAFFCVF